MKVRTLRLPILCCAVGAVCASLPLSAGSVHAVDEKGSGPEWTLFLAEGNLVSVRPNFRGYVQAVYDVADIYWGQITDKRIGVVYYAASASEGPPAQALLLLEGSATNASGFRAYRMDAGLGIVPSGSEALKQRLNFVSSGSDPALLGILAITAHEAIQAVKAFLEEHEFVESDLAYDAQRSDTGWRVEAKQPNSALNGEIVFIVGDDGRLKWVSRDAMMNQLLEDARALGN